MKDLSCDFVYKSNPPCGILDNSAQPAATTLFKYYHLLRQFRGSKISFMVNLFLWQIKFKYYLQTSKSKGIQQRVNSLGKALDHHSFFLVCCLE